jgi:predicted RNA binding protein YcfA (HicA-like mRNA interferase family)
MSKEFPALRAGVVVRALEKAGFQRVRQKGSHLVLFRDTDRRTLVVPIQYRSTVPRGTLKAIVREAGLSVDDFLRLL